MAHSGHLLSEPALQDERRKPRADQYLRRPRRDEPAHDLVRVRLDQRPLASLCFLITHLGGIEPVIGGQEPLKTIQDHQVWAATQPSEHLISQVSGRQSEDLLKRPTGDIAEQFLQEPGHRRGPLVKAPPQSARQSADRSRRPVLGPLPGSALLPVPPIASTTITGSADWPHSSSRARSVARPVNGALPTYGGAAANTGATGMAQEGDSSSCMCVGSSCADVDSALARRLSAMSRSSRNLPMSISGLTSCRDFTRAENRASASASLP